MSKTHKQWMRECIEECKTCGNLNTASGAERLIEKFAEHMDESPSGGGVTSWNDLPDRPFGEYKVVIEWDGVIGDRPTFSPESSVVFARVGDALTMDQLANAQLHYFEGSAGEYNRAFTVMEQAGLVVLMDGNTMLCIVAPAAVDLGGISITEAGTYFMRVDSSVGSGYVSCLEYDEIKRLDPKFIQNVPPLSLSADFFDSLPDMETEEEIAAYVASIKAHVEAGLPVFFEYTSGSGSGAAFVRIPMSGYFDDAYGNFYVYFIDLNAYKKHDFDFGAREYTKSDLG